MKVPQIDINPLRVLGVYANSTLREIEQNKAQLRAYARVGQKVELPLWLRGLQLLLPMDDIDEEMLTQAQSQISLKEDRDNYARFWFERDENLAQEDEKIFAMLNNRQVDEACQLLQQRTDHAAIKNLLLLNVMKPDWRGIADCACKCFEGNVNEFHLFMDEVVKASNTANSEGSRLLLYHFRDEFWKAEMRKVLINNHKRVLDGLLDRLKHVPADDVTLLKNAYDRASEDRIHLKALLNLSGEDSMIYQFYLGEFAKTMCVTLYRYASKPKYHEHEIRWACKEFSDWWLFVKETDPDYSELRSMKKYMDRAKFTIPQYRRSKSNSQSSTTSTISNSGSATTTSSDGIDYSGCTVPAAVIIAIIILFSIFASSKKTNKEYEHVKFWANYPSMHAPTTSAQPYTMSQFDITLYSQKLYHDAIDFMVKYHEETELNHQPKNE